MCPWKKWKEVARYIYGNKSLQSIIITIIIYHLKGEKRRLRLYLGNSW